MAIVMVGLYFDFAWHLANRVHVFKRGAVSLVGEASAMDRATLQAAGSVWVAKPIPEARDAKGMGRTRTGTCAHAHFG
jgi:hypothetical protein